MAESIGDLARNDVPSAVRLYLKAKEEGTWSREQAEMIFMLQDDPAELITALTKEVSG